MAFALKLTFTQKSLICPVQSAGPEFRTDIFPVRSRIPDRDKSAGPKVNTAYFGARL